MADTASRPALQNALLQYAQRDRHNAARAFLDALSVDELLFLAELLGACILHTSTRETDTWSVVRERVDFYRQATYISQRQREDADHKMMVIAEFAGHCGCALKFL